MIVGAKGFFPSRSEDATKLTSIIPLSNPHTRTTGFQGTRTYMSDLRRRRVAHDYARNYTAKNPRRFFMDIVRIVSVPDSDAR